MTQGRTFEGNENVFKAAHAIDKDLSTVAATDTDNGAGWIKLEFDRTYFINKIIIHPGFYNGWYATNDHCVESESRFKECVNDKTNVDVSVYRGDVKQKSCGTLQLTYGLGQSDQIYTLICNTEGDTVKLSKNTGITAVYELILIGTATSELKILYLCLIYSSS